MGMELCSAAMPDEQPAPSPIAALGCPACGRGMGLTVGIGTLADPRHVLLRLRCSECGHEWTTERYSPSLGAGSNPKISNDHDA